MRSFDIFVPLCFYSSKCTAAFVEVQGNLASSAYVLTGGRGASHRQEFVARPGFVQRHLPCHHHATFTTSVNDSSATVTLAC
jgi:hypothetical protein